MSRFIALAASAVLVSVAPAMADSGIPAELTNIQPYYGTPVPAPTSVTLATAQEVVAVAVPAVAPTVVATPAVAAPAAFAPVPGFSAAGLGGSALVFGGLAAAGIVGIAVLAGVASDDDDDGITSTPGT